jgi:catechol 2,3-dioxygenase-like lactoylglutathione lyase family enzyme
LRRGEKTQEKEVTMARIRHIAIATRDLEATTQFYIEGLGLKQVGKINTPTSEGYYLSDGHVNFAILKFKYDEPAKTEGTLRYTGIHHFGLEVEDMETARAQIEKAGAVYRPYPGTEEMAKRGNVEVKFSGPDGVTIDLSEHGWLGTK